VASESHARTLSASSVRLMTESRIPVTNLAKFLEGRF
jgi:hypothetical protein